MVVIQNPIGSVSVVEPLVLVTPCPVLAPTPELKHSPPSSSRGEFRGHHSPQRYLAALTLTKGFTPHQGQPRKLMALLATTLQGEDEAMTTPVLKEPLYWTVSKGSQTETHSQAWAGLLFLIEGDKWFPGICASALESTSRNVRTCLVAGNACECGTPQEGKLDGAPCPLKWESLLACWALLPASSCLHPDHMGQELGKHQQQLFISHWK